MDVAIKTSYFNASDWVSIFTLVQTLKRECDILLIQEKAATILLPTYLRDPGGATLQIQLYHQGSKTLGSIMTYWEVINYLLGTYDSDEIVLADEADVTWCVQTDGMNEAVFEALSRKKELMYG